MFIEICVSPYVYHQNNLTEKSKGPEGKGGVWGHGSHSSGIIHVDMYNGSHAIGSPAWLTAVQVR